MLCQRGKPSLVLWLVSMHVLIWPGLARKRKVRCGALAAKSESSAINDVGGTLALRALRPALD